MFSEYWVIKWETSLKKIKKKTRKKLYQIFFVNACAFKLLVWVKKKPKKKKIIHIESFLYD